MKKILYILIFLTTLAQDVFSQEVKISASSNGPWCDFLKLRLIEEKKGNKLPFSALAEIQAMGLVDGNKTFITQPTDVISYNESTHQITFTSKEKTVVLDVTTNKVVQGQLTNPYFVFAPGIGCCNCASHHVSDSTKTDTTSTAPICCRVTALNARTPQVKRSCFEKRVIECFEAEVSREGQTISDSLHIEERITACGGNPVFKNRLRKILPIVQASLSDTSISNISAYPEIARYLICGSLDSIDIRAWRAFDDTLIVSNKNLFGPEQILVSKDGYVLSYIEDQPTKRTKVLAVYDMHVGDKLENIQYALKSVKASQIDLSKVAYTDNATFHIPSMNRIVTVSSSYDFVKKCTITDEKHHTLFSLTLDLQAGKLSLSKYNKKHDIVLALITNSRPDTSRKSKREIRKVAEIFSAF